MIQVRLINSSTRVMSASERPSFRAFACFSAGSFPARIEMKITLSMPRTISRPVRVRSEIQICGSVSQSMTGEQAGDRFGGQRDPAWKIRIFLQTSRPDVRLQVLVQTFARLAARVRAGGVRAPLRAGVAQRDRAL